MTRRHARLTGNAEVGLPSNYKTVFSGSLSIPANDLNQWGLPGEMTEQEAWSYLNDTSLVREFSPSFYFWAVKLAKRGTLAGPNGAKLSLSEWLNYIRTNKGGSSFIFEVVPEDEDMGQRRKVTFISWNDARRNSHKELPVPQGSKYADVLKANNIAFEVSAPITPPSLQAGFFLPEIPSAKPSETVTSQWVLDWFKENPANVERWNTVDEATRTAISGSLWTAQDAKNRITSTAQTSAPIVRAPSPAPAPAPSVTPTAENFVSTAESPFVSSGFTSPAGTPTPSLTDIPAGFKLPEVSAEVKTTTATEKPKESSILPYVAIGGGIFLLYILMNRKG